MLKLKLHTILLLLLSCLTLFAFSENPKLSFTKEERQWMQNNPEVFFGYESRWEPYEIYEKGEYKGIVGEYVKILARETGINFRPIPKITWSETLLGLKEGTIAMAPSCAITPSRKKYLEFTDVYINDPLVIVTRKEYNYVGELGDLNGKKIAVPPKYYTGELISADYPEIILVEKSNIQKCLEALSYGEVDAFVDNLGVVNYYIHHRGFSGVKVAAPTYYEDNGIALAVNKEWKILRDIAQKVFDNITPAEQAKIRQKWVNADITYSASWSSIVKWVIVVVIILAVIIVLLYFWNNTLRKNIKHRKEAQHQLMESLIEIKKQDNEKKVLLQEIHHRVKNNLQIVSSMMSLQADISQNKAAKKTLTEAIDRIKTIALIHDKIYRSPDLGNVCLKEYSSSLIKAILDNFSVANKIEYSVNAKEVSISLDHIVPFALIINELVTNSVKYAFKETEKPKITLKIEEKEGVIYMEYADNGTWVENPKSDNFGTSLVEIFTEQLEGSNSLDKTPSGTKYSFTFFNQS